MRTRNLIIATGLAVCSLAACTREQLTPEPEECCTITAISESDATKTDFSSDFTLNWTEGDKIGVFNEGLPNRPLTLTSGAGSASATFSLDGAYSFMEGDLYAYYPYSAELELAKDRTISVDLNRQSYEYDAETKALKNSGKYFYMTGMSTVDNGETDVDVFFKNPLAAFVFSLTNNGETAAGIESVTVKAEGEVFGTAGKLNFAAPDASEATAHASSVTATLTNAVLEPGTKLNIPLVLFPNDFSGMNLTFTVSYMDGDDKAEISKTITGRSLSRNTLAGIRIDLGESNVLEELKDVLANGGEFTLPCNVTGNFTVTAETPVTINLNGFTITNDPSSEGTGDTFTVNLGSNLTISGEGTVDNTSHGKAAIYNNGTVTLKGGTYTRSAENSSYTDSEDPDLNSYYVILNHGEMMINKGVNVTVNGTRSALIHNAYDNYPSPDERHGYVEGKGSAYPSLTINGGLFEGGNNTVKNGEGGILEINGGTFPKAGTYNILNAHIATINGGEFSGASSSVYTTAEYYNEEYHKAETSIKGGIFNASVINLGDNPTITVSGGSFSCPTIITLKNLIGKLTEDADVSLSLKENLLFKNFSDPITFNVSKANIDLNGNTMSYTSDQGDAFIVSKGDITICDGKITTTKYNSEAAPYGGISVSGNASLTIEDIQMESSSTCFAVADQGSLTIRNSTVTADSYAVTSNASNPKQSITVTLEDSEFSGDTPVLLNIPSTITVDGCTITGETQGMVVRGGKATITDSNITLTIEGSIETNKEFADWFDTIDWGDGNKVNVAALTIGNKLESSYQYPTDVSLKGNTTLTVSGEAESLFPVVYAHANSGDRLGVTFNYDETVKFVGTHEPQCEYGSSNIVVNGEPFTPATE